MLRRWKRDGSARGAGAGRRPRRGRRRSARGSIPDRKEVSRDADGRDLVHQLRPVPPGAAPRPGRGARPLGRPADRLRDGRARRGSIPWRRPASASRSSGSRSSPTACSKTCPRAACARAMRRALDRDRPDAVDRLRLRAARVDGDARLGARRRAAVGPDVGEPGDRPPEGLVEGGGQAAAGPAVLVGAGGRAEAPRLPRLAGDARRPDRPGLQRRRRRRASPPRPRRSGATRTAAGGCPIGRTSWPSAGSRPRRTWSRWSRPTPATAAAPERRRPGTWSSAATARRPARSSAAVEASGFAGSIHRPGFLQAGRAGAVVRVRLGVRPPEPDGALGAGRERGGGVRPAAAGLGPRRVRRDVRARRAGDDRPAVRPGATSTAMADALALGRRPARRRAPGAGRPGRRGRRATGARSGSPSGAIEALQTAVVAERLRRRGGRSRRRAS